MKKNKGAFLLILILSLILQPFKTQAAYIDLDGNEHLKQGNYLYVERNRMPLGDSRKWIQSGYYHYEFLDSSKMYITIRKIASGAVKNGKLKIPETIDGHIVLGAGMFWDESYFDENHNMLEKEQMCILDEPQKLEELILPYTMEFLGYGSFYKCEKLEKISFYNNNGGECRLVRIETGAFGATHNMKEIVFPPGVSVGKEAFSCWDSEWKHECRLRKITIYTDNVLSRGNWFPEGEKPDLYIRKHMYPFYALTVPGDLNKLYIDKNISLFQLKIAYEEDWDDDAPPMLNCMVNKLVMNGKETVLWLPEEVNEILPAGGLQGIYTVKGAICIHEAKKYDIPVYWKTVGKKKTVKGKKMAAAKKNNIYTACWSKIKTTINKYSLNAATDRWKIKKTPAKTVYKVYGKKKKGGSYHFIKSTKKRSIKSEYKYIKAVPDKEWE